MKKQKICLGMFEVYRTTCLNTDAMLTSKNLSVRSRPHTQAESHFYKDQGCGMIIVKKLSLSGDLYETI